jgi:hypothetical protein
VRDHLARIIGRFDLLVRNAADKEKKEKRCNEDTSKNG